MATILHGVVPVQDGIFGKKYQNIANDYLRVVWLILMQD